MFTLPELPYAYNALEPYIDEVTMKIHHDLHHGTYVKNLNEVLSGHEKFLSMPIEKLLQSLDRVPEAIRMKVRNNGGGHYNHSMFWTIMAPFVAGAPQGKPHGDLGKAIDAAFGGFVQFQEKFSTAALGRFGSGWAWVTLENGSLKIEDSPNQDSPIMARKKPILGLDVWEHAYYLKYQNRRAEYIKAWWNVLNWKEVEKRFEMAMK